MRIKLQNILRNNSLSNFGFGKDAMENATVCPKCNSLENSDSTFCSKCKTRLSGATLYDLYKSQHKSCEKCGAVIADNMQYCPHCGKSVVRVKESV